MVADLFLKSVHTPFQIENKYDTDFLEELPTDKALLKSSEARYGGSYSSIEGTIMHLYVWARLIGYWICNQDACQTDPSQAALHPQASAEFYDILPFIDSDQACTLRKNKRPPFNLCWLWLKHLVVPTHCINQHFVRGRVGIKTFLANLIMSYSVIKLNPSAIPSKRLRTNTAQIVNLACVEGGRPYVRTTNEGYIPWVDSMGSRFKIAKRSILMSLDSQKQLLLAPVSKVCESLSLCSFLLLQSEVFA